MVSKADLKNLFQSSIKEMLTKREKQKKEKDSTNMDKESWDMRVFDMFTCNHTEIVRNDDSDSKSITNNLFHFEQTNETDKCYLKNNSKNNYD
jgi:deoxycytidine triphosphate deaminase